jgi:hypothetical protein
VKDFKNVPMCDCMWFHEFAGLSSGQSRPEQALSALKHKGDRCSDQGASCWLESQGTMALVIDVVWPRPLLKRKSHVATSGDVRVRAMAIKTCVTNRQATTQGQFDFWHLGPGIDEECYYIGYYVVAAMLGRQSEDGL